jgi:prepilin-type processing-associated H-X9-DG protein
MTLTRLYGWFGGPALLLAAALLMGADRDEGPADVEMIPADGALVFSFRPADLWAHDLLKPVRAKLGKEAAVVAAEMEKHLGAAPEQMERLTFMAPAVMSEPLVLVGLNKPYDKARLAELAGKEAKEETFKGRTIFAAPPRQSSVGLLGPRAYAVGNVDAIRSLMDQVASQKDGPLAEARRLVGEKHALVAALNVPALAAVVPGLPGEVEALQPLLEAKSATLVADLGTETRASLKLPFADAAGAKKGAKALREGVKLALGGLAVGKMRLAEDPDGKGLVQLVDQVAGLLKDVSVEQDGATVRAATRAKVDPVVLVPLLAEAVQKQLGSVERAQSINNLKQIALSFHNYTDTYKTFPPHAIFGKDGKPLLSWRVLILPFVGEDELYKEFHLDEPWDSEHNKKLLAKMPKVYAHPGQKGAGMTHYQGFYGKGAVFEGKNGLRFPAEFPDGTSNTIMIVEAANAVPWTKPADLPYVPDKPLPKLGGLSPGGFNAAFCDGSVHFLKTTIKPMTLHLLIQRNDGQVIPRDF